MSRIRQVTSSFLCSVAIALVAIGFVSACRTAYADANPRPDGGIKDCGANQSCFNGTCDGALNVPCGTFTTYCGDANSVDCNCSCFTDIISPYETECYCATPN